MTIPARPAAHAAANPATDAAVGAVGHPAEGDVGDAVTGDVGDAAVGAWCRLERSWYEREPLALAPTVLNKLLVVADGRTARIVEVEAYGGADDPGSHAYRGRTRRNKVMWGPAGHLYVYFSYGMHWCANVVGATDGVAGAVLLRAGAPLAGIGTMLEARRTRTPTVRERDLCRGPARLCQALAIDGRHDGADLISGAAAVWLLDDGVPPPSVPASGLRVGLSTGADLPWRFWVPGHAGVSTWRPSPRLAASTKAR